MHDEKKTRKCIYYIVTKLNDPYSIYNCIYVRYALYDKLYVNKIVICAFVCVLDSFLFLLNNCQNVDTRFSFNGDDKVLDHQCLWGLRSA